MSPNIEDFNRGCALILGHLYQHFPVPVGLDVSALATHEELDGANDARRRERIAVYEATFEFLREEGLLRRTEWIGDTFGAGVVLTAKGFSALNREVPTSAGATSEGIKRAVDVILGAKPHVPQPKPWVNPC